MTDYRFDDLDNASLAIAALRYYSVGWTVIPLEGKRPLTPWTTDPRLNADTLNILFADNVTFNIGIVMGAPSGLVGLDIDGQLGWDYLHSYLGDKHNTGSFTDACPEMFDTLNFRTPNLGHRFLYALDLSIPNTIRSRSIRSGHREILRIMSDGTQTVAPPSSLDTGKYEWLPPYHLRPAPVAILTALYDISHPPKLGRPDILMRSKDIDKVHRARRYLLKCDPAISGQGGHNHTFKIAVKLLKGFALTFHEAFALIAEWNETCLPPWSDDELAHKLEDASKVNAASGSML